MIPTGPCSGARNAQEAAEATGPEAESPPPTRLRPAPGPVAGMANGGWALPACACHPAQPLARVGQPVRDRRAPHGPAGVAGLVGCVWRGCLCRRPRAQAGVTTGVLRLTPAPARAAWRWLPPSRMVQCGENGCRLARHGADDGPEGYGSQHSEERLPGRVDREVLDQRRKVAVRVVPVAVKR